MTLGFGFGGKGSITTFFVVTDATSGTFFLDLTGFVTFVGVTSALSGSVFLTLALGGGFGVTREGAGVASLSPCFSENLGEPPEPGSETRLTLTIFGLTTLLASRIWR